MKLKQITVRLTVQTYKELKKKVIDLDRHMNDYVIELIEKDLKTGGLE